MQTNAAAPVGGRLGASGSGTGGGVVRSNVSTAPPRPLRPRQTVHPLALVDPQALSPHKRAAAAASSSTAAALVSSAAPPPPPLPRRVQQSPASTAAATSAAVHSTAAASTISTPASSVSAPLSIATRIAAKSISSRSHSSGSSGGGGGGNGWTARAAQLAAPVVQHWRLLTRSRLVQLSLDQRVADFQSRRAVRLWAALRQQSKARWKASVARRTVAAYAFLKHAFVRFRTACTAPDRPSVQLATDALLQCRAVEFFTFKRRTRALQRWKRVYAQGVLLQDQADQVAVVRATHLACAALHSWKARLARLHSADQSAHTLTQLQAQRLRRDAWMQWRSAQASSTLERVGSGVARKHAYRSVLQRAMRAWKRAVGAGLELDRLARLQLQRQRIRLLRSYWIAWHDGVHRLRALGAVVHRRAAALAAEAQRDTLRQWRDAMLSLRHTSRLMHIASRFRVRVLRRRALYLWTESLRLTRVRRLMGASAFELLRRKWSRWRAALAAQRAQTKRDKQASLHRQWRQLAVAVTNWKSFVVAHQTGRLLDERADAFLLQRTGSRLLRRWFRRARATKVALVHRGAAAQFRQTHLLQFGLRRLRSIIDSAHAQGSHRRLVRLFQRRRAFAVWRAFSNIRVAQYESARRARRFAYLRKLRVAFLGWLRQRERERGVEQRLQVRTRPILLRAQHALFRHWSALAASSRSFHRKMAAAQQLDRSSLVQSCFVLWRDRFQQLRLERQHARMAERHARLRLLSRVVYAWDAFAYQQRDVRRNVHEQVQFRRQQLDQSRRRRLFDAWRDRLAQRMLHQQQRQQAVLHHARCVLFRSYRAWQANFARRILTLQKLAALARRVELRSEKRLWALWRQSLAARRRALHKHVQSLRFWARRVMRRAWAGWAKYHRLQRLKESMMQRALEHRQAKLRRVAVEQWIVAGLELHERSLLAAQRDDHSGEFTLRGRRAALKYGRLWRFLAHRNALKDARRGSAITASRVASLLPLGLGSYRPPPLPLRSHAPSAPMWQTHERKYDGESKERAEPSSSSMSAATSVFAPRPAVSTLDAAAALFPRLPPANRPPPRRPLDLDAAFMPLPTPVLQLPISEQFMPAAIPRTTTHSASAHHPGAATFGPFVAGTAAAASVLPVSRDVAQPSPYLTPPSSSGLTSPTHAHGVAGMVGLSPLPPSALGLPAPSQPAAATAAASSPSTDFSPSFDPDPSAVEQAVLALEEQLHRLLEWKADSKQRRQRLQQIEEQLAHAVGADRSSLLAEHRSLQAAVAADTEHRPYWCEQVRLVQQRISEQMNAAETDG